MEKSWEWGIDQYALSVDLEKACDRVIRNHLWKVLKENRYNIPTNMIRVIHSIYSQCTSKVNTSKIESEAVSIESGVRQGDALSPLLLIIFMDRCIRDVTIGENGEETVMHADDVVVVANSLTNSQEVASRWWRGMSQNGMKINTRKGKTEIVHISRHTMQCEVYMGGNKLNQVDTYKHLGVNVGERNLQEVEINNRIAKYNSNSGLTYPLLKDKNIPRTAKSRSI